MSEDDEINGTTEEEGALMERIREKHGEYYYLSPDQEYSIQWEEGEESTRWVLDGICGQLSRSERDESNGVVGVVITEARTCMADSRIHPSLDDKPFDTEYIVRFD